MHSSKGYCSYHGEIENFQTNENDHVKEIFNSINNFSIEVMKLNKNTKICIVGLGYVGLPLAIALQKYFNVVGYDVNPSRINSLNKNIDSTEEVTKSELKRATSIRFTYQKKKIGNIDIFIVTVPTPIFKSKIPDLRLLKKACTTVSQIIKKNNIVIFESTVYPGVTEEVCAKLIEKKSGLKFNKDFFVDIRLKELTQEKVNTS